MTIGRKISLAFAAVLVSLGLISTVVSRSTAELIENNRWVVHTRAVLELLETVDRAANRSEGSVLGFLITGEDTRLAASIAARYDVDRAVKELATLTQDNPSQQSRTSILTSKVAEYYARLDTMIVLRQTGVLSDVVQSVFTSGYGPALEEVRRLVGEMAASEQQLLGARMQESDATAATALFVVRWGGLATLVVCLVIAALLTISIVRPVRALVTGATALGAGNLSYRTVTGTSDELGLLGDAFNAMADNLGRTMVTADTEKRARARVETLLQTVAETATHLVSATSEIVAATTQQAAGAREQVAAVARTVSTVDEVVHSAEQARDRARAVAAIAAESVRHGRSGRQVVQESLQAMQGLRELVERSAERTLELGEHAQQIGSVIQGVTEIAEQTNILALNASIEGAKAGQEGETFRVVATRVRALAGQSKEAADTARATLRDVHAAASGLIALAEACSNEVVTASAIIGRADASIAALADIIDHASQAAVQIVASASQQAHGTAQIHEAMKQINAITVQSLGSTRQMEQAAKDLSELGGRLREESAGLAATGV